MNRLTSTLNPPEFEAEIKKVLSPVIASYRSQDAKTKFEFFDFLVVLNDQIGEVISSFSCRYRAAVIDVNKDNIKVGYVDCFQPETVHILNLNFSRSLIEILPTEPLPTVPPTVKEKEPVQETPPPTQEFAPPMEISKEGSTHAEGGISPAEFSPENRQSTHVIESPCELRNPRSPAKYTVLKSNEHPVEFIQQRVQTVFALLKPFTNRIPYYFLANQVKNFLRLKGVIVFEDKLNFKRVELVDKNLAVIPKDPMYPLHIDISDVMRLCPTLLEHMFLYETEESFIGAKKEFKKSSLLSIERRDGDVNSLTPLGRFIWRISRGIEPEANYVVGVPDDEIYIRFGSVVKPPTTQPIVGTRIPNQEIKMVSDVKPLKPSIVIPKGVNLNQLIGTTPPSFHATAPIITDCQPICLNCSKWDCKSNSRKQFSNDSKFPCMDQKAETAGIDSCNQFSSIVGETV